jgi:hypothetical protein
MTAGRVPALTWNELPLNSSEIPASLRSAIAGIEAGLLQGLEYTRLPFCPEGILWHLWFPAGASRTTDADAFVIVFDGLTGQDPYMLDWTNEPFYRLSELKRFRFSSHPNIYIRCFFYLVRGSLGRFIILENEQDLEERIPWRRDIDNAEAAKSAAKENIRQFLAPLTRKSFNASGGAIYRACILFKNALFHSDVVLDPSGTIELTNEDLKLEDLPVNVMAGLERLGERRSDCRPSHGGFMKLQGGKRKIGFAIIATFVFPAAFILFGGWISGLRFAMRPNPMSTIETRPLGASGEAELKPPQQSFLNCDARPVSGSALFLLCGSRSEIVVLDAVHTMPPGTLLGNAAAAALATMVADKSPVDCVPGLIGYECHTRGYNLTDALLATGLGVTNDRSRFEIERRAMLTGQGIWSDWAPSDREGVGPNPPNAVQVISWRASKDAIIGQTELAQAGRAQAFAGFCTGALLVGGLLAFMRTERRAAKSAESQEAIISSELGQIRDALSSQVEVIKINLQDMNADQLLQEWKKFDSVYAKYKDYCSGIREDIRRDKGGEFEYTQLRRLEARFLPLHKLHAALSHSFKRFEPRLAQSQEHLELLRQEVISHIIDYEKEEDRNRA